MYERKEVRKEREITSEKYGTVSCHVVPCVILTND